MKISKRLSSIVLAVIMFSAMFTVPIGVSAAEPVSNSFSSKSVTTVSSFADLNVTEVKYQMTSSATTAPTWPSITGWAATDEWIDDSASPSSGRIQIAQGAASEQYTAYDGRVFKTSFVEYQGCKFYSWYINIGGNVPSASGLTTFTIDISHKIQNEGVLDIFASTDGINWTTIDESDSTVFSYENRVNGVQMIETGSADVVSVKVNFDKNLGYKYVKVMVGRVNTDSSRYDITKKNHQLGEFSYSWDKIDGAGEFKSRDITTVSSFADLNVTEVKYQMTSSATTAPTWPSITGWAATDEWIDDSASPSSGRIQIAQGAASEQYTAYDGRVFKTSFVEYQGCKFYSWYINIGGNVPSASGLTTFTIDISHKIQNEGVLDIFASTDGINWTTIDESDSTVFSYENRVNGVQMIETGSADVVSVKVNFDKNLGYKYVKVMVGRVNTASSRYDITKKNHQLGEFSYSWDKIDGAGEFKSGIYDATDINNYVKLYRTNTSNEWVQITDNIIKDSASSNDYIKYPGKVVNTSSLNSAYCGDKPKIRLDIDSHVPENSAITSFNIDITTNVKDGISIGDFKLFASSDNENWSEISSDKFEYSTIKNGQMNSYSWASYQPKYCTLSVVLQKTDGYKYLRVLLNDNQTTWTYNNLKENAAIGEFSCVWTVEQLDVSCLNGGVVNMSYKGAKEHKTFIAAFYNEDGNLIKIESENNSVLDECNFTAPIDAAYVTGFLWSGFNDMIPLTESVTKGISGCKQSNILIIGGRNSADCSCYFPSIINAKNYDATVYRLYAKNLWIIDHWRNTITNANDYTYYVDEMKQASKKNINDVVNNIKFDAIVIEQASGISGDEDMVMNYLQYFVDYLKSNQQDATIFYNSGWAFPNEYTGMIFDFYENDSKKMSDRITSAMTYVMNNTTDLKLIDTNMAVETMRSSNVFSTTESMFTGKTLSTNHTFYFANEKTKIMLAGKYFKTIFGTAPTAIQLKSAEFVDSTGSIVTLSNDEVDAILNAINKR